MADERSRPPYNQPSLIAKKYAWPTLLAKDGDGLFYHYRHVLEALGKEKGTLGLIFGKAQNKFQDPAKLRRVIVDLIDKEDWSAMTVDVKGDAYEGLLQKNAEWLKRWTSTRINVEGHCDERGSAEYNLALGERRANAVKDYLVSLGVPADRVVTVTKGREAPFCSESGEACWQQNRRGHFIITAK